MKMTIAKKLFFAVILIVAVVVLLMVALIKVSLGDGFDRYLYRVELARVEPVARKLEQLYERFGNWDFVETNPDLVWQEMQNAMVVAHNPNRPMPFPSPPPAPPDFGPPEGIPHPPEGDGHGRFPLFHPLGIPPHIMELLHRVVIFDGDKNRIWGEPAAVLKAGSLVLAANGKQIGYVALARGPSMFSEVESDFISEQNKNILLIAAAGILAACVAAYLVSRNLVSAINVISAGIHKLASRDFTARLDLDRTDELGQLGREFNVLAESLERQDRKSKQWVADTSHELRTPIAILRAQVEAFQDRVQEVNPKTLSVLHGEVMSLSRLVDDLHWLARFDIDNMRDTLLPIDIVSTLSEVLDKFEERFREKKISLEFGSLSGKRYIVEADANRIKQVFINLLENSLRYTDAGGKVQVGASADGKMAVISLDDSEPAVPEALLSQIFERFFRIESSRSREFGGSGLGLAISKAIVDAHGGTISAARSELGGLRIDLRLPLAKGGIHG